MHMPEASVRFGLMLEAYCRGAVAHIKSLLRQVCILKSIHTSTFVEDFLAFVGLPGSWRIILLSRLEN